MILRAEEKGYYQQELKKLGLRGAMDTPIGKRTISTLRH
jgi:hypothetical protein